MADKLEPGKRYRVTAVVEGVANRHGAIEGDVNYVFYSDGYGATRIAGDATLIEEIAPTYHPGRVYRDADGDLFVLEPGSNFSANEWLAIGGYGFSIGEFYPLDDLNLPLTELELKEKN